MKYVTALILFLTGCTAARKSDEEFVKVSNHQFFVNEKPYQYIGANYWYGGLLPLTEKGKQRLLKELDFLSSNGVNNLRIMAGAEGEGMINAVPRVEPALQTEAGRFNKEILTGLDFLLSEMAKRRMKAVIFFSNNWEWSGGFLQYLNWNGIISDTILRRKLSWDEMRDFVSRFYSCASCKEQYKNQLELIVTRKNSFTGKSYSEDPVIMAWEIANEPRPMRPAAIQEYSNWLEETSAYIKSLDTNHLVTIGSEGEMGSENLDVFKAIHSDKNIDYATIHIWPKNWSWFKDTAISKDMATVTANTITYIDKHAAVAKEIKKPLVIEEFGLPRNQQSFHPGSATSLREAYYQIIFEKLIQSINTAGVIAGVNFWSFGGSGRPSGKQLLWTKGDDLLGDPPVEEQGLNSVFDSDVSTWKLIDNYQKKIAGKHEIN